MKTHIIFLEDAYTIKFLILDGDYSHLKDVFINVEPNLKLEQELHKLLYNDNGNFLIKEVTQDRFHHSIQSSTNSTLITCGFVN